MEISDNDLCMLEQLTYLDKDVLKEAGISNMSYKRFSKSKDNSLSTFLNQFTDASLDKLASNKDNEIGGSHMKGSEWAGIIRYLKSKYTGGANDLYLTDVHENKDKTPLALCFTKTKDSKEAIVAFKGTSGGEEWADNVQGFNQNDTACQRDALEYIQSLPYTDITVTGHSKGGNKAMYVAITSDKVTRCLAMDAQGFSQEFIDKYWAEIQQRGKNITNFSLSVDYVHALMFQIPNSNQVYFEGFDLYDAAQFHCPNAYFKIDEDGNIVLENGEIAMRRVNMDSDDIKFLHNFTTFVLNNADDKDKKLIVDFLSRVAPILMCDPKNEKGLKQAIGDNPEALAAILAYLAKYMQTYDLGEDDIYSLLRTLKMGFAQSKLFAKFANMLKRQLSDDNNDWITKYILSALKHFFADDVDIDVDDVWNMAQEKQKHISSVQSSTAKLKDGRTYDYSLVAYQAAMTTINSIEHIGNVLVNTWDQYADREWHSALFISGFEQVIDTYFDNLSASDSDSKQKIVNAFNDVSNADVTCGTKVDAYNTDIRTITDGITQLCNYINV